MASNSRGARLISASILPKVQVRLRRSRTKALAIEISRVMSDAAVLAEGYVLRETAAPSSSRRPINWTSSRQQKAYFASNGFGNGIPYDRSGQLESGWYVDATKAKQRQVYSFTIGNDAPYASFVYGGFTSNDDFQQVFHWISKWPNVRGLDERTYETVIRPAVEAGIADIMGEHEQQLTFGITQLLYDLAQQANKRFDQQVRWEEALALRRTNVGYRNLADLPFSDARAVKAQAENKEREFSVAWSEFLRKNYGKLLAQEDFYFKENNERKPEDQAPRRSRKSYHNISSYKRRGPIPRR